MFLSIYPGDPSTPGYPAYENSTSAEGGSIPKIPSLPISWENAERLLEEIDHPFVVNLRYAFQDDENCFFVLDLMLGGDLRCAYAISFLTLHDLLSCSPP